MKNLVCLAPAVFILSLGNGILGASPEKLQISFKVQPIGKDRGKLIISFKPSPKYDFNKTPPMSVEVEPAQGVQWDKKKQLPMDGKPILGSQFYGQIQPVEFNYSLASVRVVEVQAKITYFYCSKKDGFCAREIRKIIIPLGPGS